MLRTTTKRLARLAIAPLALGLAALSLTTSAGAAPPVPPGCDNGYQGQAISAVVGVRSTFHFNGFNAVPPGHRATAVRVSWGDGKSGHGSAATHRKPVSKGCYLTVLTARHTYSHITCTGPGGVCSHVYKVVVRYRDAKTHARYAMTKLRIVAVRRDK